MIWNISVESDYQMSNWAINRYSFQINIIGGPKKKTKWLFSLQTESFLNPAVRPGMSTKPSFFKESYFLGLDSLPRVTV